jgi:long-subunit acyl-CoA synthetase (AMP-forming)
MDDVYISYLPLAHIFDRVIEEVFIRHGASIGFWRGVRIQNTCPTLLLTIFLLAQQQQSLLVLRKLE